MSVDHLVVNRDEVQVGENYADAYNLKTYANLANVMLFSSCLYE